MGKKRYKTEALDIKQIFPDMPEIEWELPEIEFDEEWIKQSKQFEDELYEALHPSEKRKRKRK